MSDDTSSAAETRTIAVRLPANYHKAVRTIGAEHDLDNTQVIMWAIDLLRRYEAEGGTYAR